MQAADGSIPAPTHDRPLTPPTPQAAVAALLNALDTLAPHFPHDAAYHAALRADLSRWADDGFGVPDFLDSLLAFRPELQRVDGLEHLVVFPMVVRRRTDQSLP